MSGDEGRRWHELLRDPVFGRFFWSKLLSAIGMWMHNVVAAVLVFELTGSALMVGLVGVAQFTPQLLLAMSSGAHADRGDRRRQLMVGRVIASGASGAFALLIVLGAVGNEASAWLVVAIAFVVGVGYVIGNPAMNALVPQLVSENEVPVAVTLNSVPATLARAIGPLAGTVVALAAGPALSFALAALTNLVFVWAVYRIPARMVVFEAGDEKSTILGGLSYIRRHRRILLLLLGVGAVGFGVDPALTLVPSLSAQLVGDTSLVGLFASAFGVGAGLAFVVVGRLRHRLGAGRAGVGGLVGLVAGLGGLALNGVPAVAVVLFFLCGLGMTMALTNFSIELQLLTPVAMRGRIMALWSVGFLGTRPIAAAINGLVADAAGPQAAMALTGTAVGVIAWLCWPRRRPDETSAP